MQLRFSFFRIVSVLSVALIAIAVSCGSGGSSKDEAKITVENGGELRSEDGSFVLTVPPNAVSEDVTISVEEISPEDADDRILNAEGPRFELQPDGLQFSQPARVTLNLPVEGLDVDEDGGLPAFDLLVIDAEGGLEALGDVENAFDLAAGELSVSGDVSHFSRLTRTKRVVSASLTDLDTSVVGQPRLVEASVLRIGGGNIYDISDISWSLEAVSNVRLDVPNTAYSVLGHGFGQLRVNEPFTVSGNTITAEATRIDGILSGIRVQSNVICQSTGTGLYSLRVVATPVSENQAASTVRPIKISITADVICISEADDRATAQVAVDETVRAGGADLVFTATPAPPGFVASPTPTAAPTPTLAPSTVPASTATPTAVPTPVPTVAPAPGEIQLRVIATTGEIVPGPDLESFSTFELPQVSSDHVIFYGFNDSGTTGIWRADQSPDNTRLFPVVESTVERVDGTYAFINSVSFVINDNGDIVFLARFRFDNDFTEGVYRLTAESFQEIALEGVAVPGGADGEEFRQFDTAQITANGGVLFESPAAGDGFWFRGATGTILPVVTEGQELPGLAGDWRDTSSRRMRSAGVTDDGKMLFFLADYRRTTGGIGEETGGGIWLLKPDGNDLIARTGMQAPDLTTFTNFFDPSMNASGQVAFHGRSQLQIGNEVSTNDAIWKTDGNGGLVKVAEQRIIVGPDNLELANVSQPIIQPDGSVIFVGSAFDDTNSLIYFVLKGAGTGIEVLARTDSLPTPGGNISAVPFDIGTIATNRHGAVAFTVGSDLWMRSADGSITRIVGQGDSLVVPAGPGTVSKTVSFIEFVGGATTNMGLPTGFSDDEDVVVKVTFFDGTEAIVLAFSEDDLPGF